MMLIITDKKPEKAVNYLINKTNKNFCFKQLLELAQLICSANISNVYKSIPQGKQLQEWIKSNKLWTYRFYTTLLFWALSNIKAKPKTFLDLYNIRENLYDSIERKKRISYPKTGIFRYKKGYKINIESNSVLEFNECIEEYKKYLDWKVTN